MNLPQAQAEVEEWNTMIVVAIAILGVALVVWWKLDSLYAIARGMWNHVRPVVQWFVFLGGIAAIFFLFVWRGGLIWGLNESLQYGIVLTVVILVFSLLRFRPYKAKRILGTVRQTAPAKFIMRIRLIGHDRSKPLSAS